MYTLIVVIARVMILPLPYYAARVMNLPLLPYYAARVMILPLPYYAAHVMSSNQW